MAAGWGRVSLVTMRYTPRNKISQWAAIEVSSLVSTCWWCQKHDDEADTEPDDADANDDDEDDDADADADDANSDGQCNAPPSIAVIGRQWQDNVHITSQPTV